MRYIVKFVLVFALVYTAAIGGGRSDEGTSDPDFDYLPPEEVSFLNTMMSYAETFFGLRAHSGSYGTAKRRLYNDVQDGETFYCGCKPDLNARTFDKQSCGYTPRNDNNRARRLEAEHILPAHWIAEFHTGESCWVAHESCGGARECCLANDARFKKAHNDLVNLIPSIGELNAARNDHIYDLISGETRAFGACDFEVDTSARTTEPKEDIRGDIARVYFYMRDTYQLEYPEPLATHLNSWNAADPVSDQERARNESVATAQGSSNPLIGN